MQCSATIMCPLVHYCEHVIAASMGLKGYQDAAILSCLQMSLKSDKQYSTTVMYPFAALTVRMQWLLILATMDIDCNKHLK